MMGGKQEPLMAAIKNAIKNAIGLAAATLVVAVVSAPAQAERITHRTAVPAGDATPTNGSFSIRFPIACNDIELTVEDPQRPALVVHVLSGINDEALRFSATETPVQGPPKPLDTLLEAAKNRHGVTVTDIKREQDGGTETLSFALTEPKEGSFFRSIRTKTTGYVLVVQFPNAMDGTASRMKDEFFNSFKITKPK
jgi:hypothetical protein